MKITIDDVEYELDIEKVRALGLLKKMPKLKAGDIYQCGCGPNIMLISAGNGWCIGGFKYNLFSLLSTDTRTTQEMECFLLDGGYRHIGKATWQPN